MEIEKYLFKLQRTWTLKRAHKIGDDRLFLLLGIGVVKNKKGIRLFFFRRRLLQTRIN